jgi:hypothetical protein
MIHFLDDKDEDNFIDLFIEMCDLLYRVDIHRSSKFLSVLNNHTDYNFFESDL